MNADFRPALRPRSIRRRAWLAAPVAVVVVVAVAAASMSGPDSLNAADSNRATSDPVTASTARPDRASTSASTTPSTTPSTPPPSQAEAASSNPEAERVDGNDPIDALTAPAAVVGSVIQGPVAPAPQPASTTELGAVEPFAPASIPALPLAPSPLNLLNTAGGPGGLTSNAPGCASRCITVASISFDATSTTIQVDIAANTAARFQLYLSTTVPTMGPTGPAMPGVDPISNGRFTRAWNRSISGLAANADHHVILRATDRNGATQIAVGSFRSVNPLNPAGDLAPAPSCAFQCISSGVVRPGGRFDAVRLEVRTTVAATLQVAVSTKAPQVVGGTPTLTPEVVVFVPSGLANSWNLNVTSLQASTTYHALVTATDAQGRSTRRVGSFRTGEAPPIAYRAQLNRVTVAYDGDPGDLNRGELGFAWGYRDAAGLRSRGNRSEAKMHDGDGFETAPHNGFVGSIRPDGSIPSLVFTVTDRDTDGVSFEFCDHGAVPVLRVGPEYNDGCDSRLSGVETGAMSPAQVMSLPRCSAFGFEGDLEDAFCKLVDTGDHGDNYARAWTVVSYELS